MSLNQIIDQTPLSSLVVDNTLNLKARNLRVFGDVTAGSFNNGAIPSQTSYTIPYTVIGYDAGEHAVTGSGVIGSMLFIKTGRVVSAFLPEFIVSSFVTGGASQELRIKFDSVLPTAIIPQQSESTAVRVSSGGSTLTSFGIAHLVALGDRIEVNSDAALGKFTVSCGITRHASITYETI